VTRQQPPIKPNRETSKRKAPRMMMGFSRNLSHSEVACLWSHMPVRRIGIERSRVRKLRIPIKLLLIFMMIEKAERERERM
jgi:hypothetical protein